MQRKQKSEKLASVYHIVLLKNYKNNTGKNGFSLVELIAVMLVLTVLTAIAVPLYINHKNKAVITTAQTDGRTIAEELRTILTSPGCTSMGTAPPNNTTFVTLSSDNLTLTYTGTHNCPTTSGSTYVVPGIKLSPKSRIKTSGYGTSLGIDGSADWCFAIQNSGSSSDAATTTNTVVYTKDGLIPSKTGCNLNGNPEP